MKQEILVGLDIGSSNIHLVAGYFDEEKKLQILGAIEHPSEGVIKGNIVSVEDLVSSISRTLEKAERVIGSPIDEVVLGFTGLNVSVQSSQGIIVITRANGEITSEEIERAIESAETVSIPVNYEVIHNLPTSYSVDDQKKVRDPLGMSARKLEVETFMIQAFSTYMSHLSKAVFRAGIKVSDIVYNGLAASEAVLDSRQKELGVVLVDIGASSTTLTVYEENSLLMTRALPVGSAYITNDINIGLRIDVDLAEKVKLFYGTALSENVDKKEEINLAEIDENENETVMKKELANIIEARVEEIFKMADEELQRIGRSGKLPAGVVLVGGGSKLEGMLEIAKNQFRLPVSIGKPKGIHSVIDKVDDPAFATAIGLVVVGSHVDSVGGGVFSRISQVSDGISNRIKKIFKSLS